MSSIKVENFINIPLKDKKINANSWMTTMKISDYLNMVTLEENPYQRSLQQLSFYKKLINDLLNDGVMPPISVVYNGKLEATNHLLLSKDTKFKIIDGLQRTNCLFACLQKLKKDPSLFTMNEATFLQKKIYVEIWENIDLSSILYKMVVLNTGQKKMDYAHQLDILSESLESELKQNNIDYIKTIDKANSPKSMKFFLSDIVTGLISYINRAPISSKKNAAEFLFNKLDIENNNEDDMKLIDNTDTYKNLIWTLKDFTQALDVYYTRENNPLIKYDVFLVSFLSALGNITSKAPSNEKLKQILEEKKALLLNISADNDVLQLNKYQDYLIKFKSGIGDKRRKFIFEAFTDFLKKDSIAAPHLEWSQIYADFFDN